MIDLAVLFPSDFYADQDNEQGKALQRVTSESWYDVMCDRQWYCMWSWNAQAQMKCFKTMVMQKHITLQRDI